MIDVCIHLATIFGKGVLDLLDYLGTAMPLIELGFFVVVIIHSIRALVLFCLRTI
jgi:hypothetical protein